MIPKDFITEWRDHAPWVTDRQVEQDLVISRALVELFPALPSPRRSRFGAGLRSTSSTSGPLLATRRTST